LVDCLANEVDIWPSARQFTLYSWITPVDARRVRPYEDANDIAAEQVEALIRRLPEQLPAPLFVFDAWYACTPAAPSTKIRPNRSTVL
jgi:hypothetical protein